MNNQSVLRGGCPFPGAVLVVDICLCETFTSPEKEMAGRPQTQEILLLSSFVGQ